MNNEEIFYFIIGCLTLFHLSILGGMVGGLLVHAIYWLKDRKKSKEIDRLLK